MTTFHCLFEQSATFRDVFRSYGHRAYTYDIANDYNKTDYQIDLFQQIESKYLKLTTPANKLPCGVFEKDTIFCNMTPETAFIIAFFPCTYFSIQNELIFTGKANGGRVFNTTRSGILKILGRAKERERYYELFIKFCYVCQELGIPTIIENPWHENYLRKYSPFYKGIYIEKDRTLFGDKLIKPTMFIPINFVLKENFQMFDKEIKKSTPINKQPGGKCRSEITPRYANNFYKRFIENTLKKEQL